MLKQWSWTTLENKGKKSLLRSKLQALLVGANDFRQWKLGCIFYYIFRGRNGLGVLAQRKKWSQTHLPKIWILWKVPSLFVFPSNTLWGTESNICWGGCRLRFPQTEDCSKKLIKSSLTIGEMSAMNRGVCARGWAVGGGGDSTTFSSGYLTNVCTRPLLPFSSLSPPSDWLNWIKMTPIIGSSWGRCADPTIHI